MVAPAIDIPQDALADFCRRHGIHKLSLFGSVLRDDFRPDSDVDVLVEFRPGKLVGWEIANMEEQLSQLLGGRKVDLVRTSVLYHRLKDRILASAQVQYEEGCPCLHRAHAGVGLRRRRAHRRLGWPAFEQDSNLFLAVTHLIQIIGEAARRVSEEFRGTHPEIPWATIVGMRHKIVHDYIHIDVETVWETATIDLPTLVEQLEQIPGV